MIKGSARLIFPWTAAAPFALAATVLAAAEPYLREYPVAPLPVGRKIAPGPVGPTWDSLVQNYKCPDWFRDAKFGIWAHWSAQCVPEQGDWYARAMYNQGNKDYEYHVRNYDHPSRFGFMEIDHLWTAEHWDPEKLMQLYVDAGAKYFVALANHEDNFDAYNSKYFAWNSMNVGPHRDIIGTWARVARAHGLRFGVSNHSSHAWHWFQPAYGYDAEGPLAGVRYDAYRLTKADGKGTWWEGLDPQDLYCGPKIVIPDGITSIKVMHAWHDAHDLPWTEDPPPDNPRFADLWYYRLQDLVEKYDPDFLYLDNTGMPLGQAGLDAAANFYNANITRHGGKLDAVLTSKGLRGDRQKAVVQDFERSRPMGGIHPYPFETGTCIGEFHYHRDIEYKTQATVLQMLVDVVSKNGTMLLSIPMRGDGTIDEREEAFLKGMAKWMAVNGGGIFNSRPWKVFGEGPTEVPLGRAGDKALPYTQQDLRFTTRDGNLYLFVLTIPTDAIAVKSRGLSSEYAQPVREISLIGSDEPVRWKQGADSLVIEKPGQAPSADVISYRITFN